MDNDGSNVKSRYSFGYVYKGASVTIPPPLLDAGNTPRFRFEGTNYTKTEG